MLIKIPTEHTAILKDLDQELRRAVEEAAGSTDGPPADHNGNGILEQLSAIAARYVDESTSLELAVHIRRRALAAQWEYLSKKDCDSHLFLRVIDQMDVIGYEHPATWADIRLALASQYERESQHDRATEIRAEVRGQARRLVSELQFFKHVR